MKKILPLIILFLFSFSAIHAEQSGVSGNINWVFSDDGTLTISGTGDMPDYSDYAPWYKYINKIKKVVIKDGVTNIGDYAFLNFYYLTSITIPNSVTSIGNWAFYGCSGLTSVTIPNSVTSIGGRAFYGCSGLTSVTIPNSVTSIGNYVFRDCSGLTSVTIPNSVTSIGDCAFEGCSSLTSITIPNSVTDISNWAFYGCSGLTSVTIPNSVRNIGHKAFYGCSSLTSITFERTTVPWFGENVFYKVDKSIPVYVPFGSRAAYKEVLGNFGMTNIIQPSLSLTGSESYTQNSQVDGAEVSFTRSYTANWEALYLPFSLEYKDWKDDFEVARINAVRQYDDNDDGNIDRTILEFVKMKNDDSVIEPNTPYLIKAKKAGEKTISVENTTVYEAKANSIECSTTTEQFTFIGLYKKPSLMFFSQTFISKYVMDNGLLSELTTQSDIGPYRWYMTRENRNSVYGINNNTAKEISIRVVGEETTGIANIQLTSPNTQTYDLNGRKVNENNLKPGMYVKNGRKVIIK